MGKSEVSKAAARPAVQTPVTAGSMPVNPTVLIPIKNIVADPKRNIRSFIESAASLKGLATSVKRNGVLEALLVRKHQEREGKYELCAGYRRLAAAKLNDLKVVPCTIMDLDNEGMLRTSIAENLPRVNLTPMELARAIVKARQELDWEGENHTTEIAELFGMSRANITQHEKLLKLAVHQQRLVHERVLGAQAGQDIAAIIEEFGEEKGQQVLERAAEIEADRKNGKRDKRKEKVGEKERKTRSARPPKAKAAQVAEAETGTEPEEKPRITQHSVRKAARELGADNGKARKIGDFVELMDILAGADNPGLRSFGERMLRWQRGQEENEELVTYLKEVFQ